MKKRHSIFLHDEAGVAAIEFAFCLPIFLMFILGMFAFSQMYWMWNTMNYAVNEAGRYVMAHATASTTDIQEKINANLMGINPADITVNVSETKINGVPFKQIQASYSYKFNVLKGFFGLVPSSLTTQTLVPES